MKFVFSFLGSSTLNCSSPMVKLSGGWNGNTMFLQLALQNMIHSPSLAYESKVEVYIISIVLRTCLVVMMPVSLLLGLKYHLLSGYDACFFVLAFMEYECLLF